jgi:hypothetical protein
MAERQRMCLIVERHDWETGAHRHQLQIPLVPARSFFGPDNADRDIQIRVFMPPAAPAPAFVADVTISHAYGQSRTRRLNRFSQMGSIVSAFVFFEETEQPNVYDMWWQIDRAIVAARYHPWHQARGSQYGRGRLAIIVPAPVPRVIEQL